MLGRFHKLPLLFYFLFACHLLAALPTDSLVSPGDLSFKNAVEKRAFIKGGYTETDQLVELLLSPYNKEEGYSADRAKQRINDCVAFLKNEIGGQTDHKKIKLIFKYVHQTFLKVYALKNSFSDVFENGAYNCVSGSALYAIVFSRLDIPYQIIEMPQHVFLIAYPATHKILVESTIPDKGYYQINARFSEKYIKYLYDSKLITKLEMDTSNADRLFNRHYFSSADISLRQLAGLQYSNYGIYHLEDEKYGAAVSEIKKSYLLFPGPRSRYLLRISLLALLSNSNYNDNRQVHNLAVLCRYNNLQNKEVSDELVKNEFLRLMHAQLTENANYARFDTSFQVVSQSLSDSALKSELSFDYHYELARLGLINRNPENYEMSHLTAAYAIKPQQVNLQGIILAYFSQQLETTGEPQAIMRLIGDYQNRFGFLAENKQFTAIKANCLLELSYRYFTLQDATKGESYLRQFETLCSADKEIEPSVAYVEKAYSVAAGLYYKKGNTAKSKQTLKTGLLYAPDSFGLKLRLNQLH